MKLSQEEIREIDAKIKQAEELQLKNGNKVYTIKEAWEIINKALEEKAIFIK